MYKYFKTMHSVAETDNREFSDILELTKALALSGGYKREIIGGKSKVSYNSPATWDNALVAKWFCFYEKLFYSVLLKHPEMKEYYDFILNETFTRVFAAIDLNKLASPKMVTSLVTLSLSQRIGQTLIYLGSQRKLEALNNGTLNKYSDRINMNSAINNMASSLEGIQEESGAMFSNNSTIEDYDIIFDLREKLKDNSLGLRLLDAMLYSNGQISRTSLEKFIVLSPYEKAHKQETISLLTSAWVLIAKTLRNYMSDYSLKSKYNWDYMRKASLNFRNEPERAI